MSEADKVKVLIADDDALTRTLVKKSVESMDFEVVAEAENGEEAINLYKQLKPDILLLDLDMPEKNGEHVLKEIIRDYPDAFIIMLSRFNDSRLKGDCIGLGAVNFITKDVGRNEIKKIIKESWDKRSERKSDGL